MMTLVNLGDPVVQVRFLGEPQQALFSNPGAAAGAKPRRQDPVVPSGAWPRGLSLEEAAAYAGIGRTLFLRMVTEGSLPQPVRFGSRTLWDRTTLDSAFERLGKSATGNSRRSQRMEDLSWD